MVALNRAVALAEVNGPQAALPTLNALADDKRMADDYALVKEYIGLDKEFDVKTVYTNEFLDRSIKMTK